MLNENRGRLESFITEEIVEFPCLSAGMGSAFLTGDREAAGLTCCIQTWRGQGRQALALAWLVQSRSLRLGQHLAAAST